MVPGDLAERVWRVRKDHTWIDAQLRDRSEAPGVEVRFFYDGTLVLAQRCPTRDEGLACAAGYLHDLQRAGWVTHW